jgi:hypothetical protein
LIKKNSPPFAVNRAYLSKSDRSGAAGLQSFLSSYLRSDTWCLKVGRYSQRESQQQTRHRDR